MRTAIRTPFLLALALFPEVLLAQGGTTPPGKQPPTTSAQPKLDARSFIPTEPKVEVFADLAAMRESGVWDGLATSLGALVLKPAEAQLGFSLEAVDRVRCYPPGRSEEAQGRHSGLVIFEGNDQVNVAPDRADTATRSVGVHEVLVDTRFGGEDPDVWFAPRTGVLVWGALHHVEPVLLGKQQPGVPLPELQSLTAVRGAVAYTVGVLEDDSSGKELMQMLQAPAGTPPPRFLLLRLRQEKVEGQDEPAIILEATARWHDDDKTPALLAAHVRTKIEELKTHKRFGAWKRYLSKIEVQTDARDLKASLVLGKPRDAGAAFITVIPFLMASESRVETITVETATEEAPPAPAPKPAGNGQGRGGK